MSTTASGVKSDTKQPRKAKTPKAKAKAKPPNPAALTAALQGLVQRANAGDRQAVTDLRQALDEHPEIWQSCGNLSKMAERAWLELIGGDQVLSVESIKRSLKELKADLLGPHPTVIERVLVDSAAISYLALRHSEISAANPGSQSLGLATLRLRRCESAHRRFTSSLKILTLLRAKAPEGLVPLNGGLRLYTGEEDRRKRA